MHIQRLAILLLPVLALGMDQPTAVAGLKEALRVGARNAVALTSRTDGYFGNPKIRIPVPESLKTMTRGLRKIGLRGQVEEFELAMNRAAETASGEAFEVFAAAIEQMAFSDARAILAGGETAATGYFRSSTSDELRTRFAPIVDRGMRQVGLVQTYERLLQHWRAMPLAPEPQLDLNEYVTEEALDGLFFVIGEEERKIRTDPAARATDLLRSVFGSRSPS